MSWLPPSAIGGSSSLHESAPFECGNIFRRQLEPFTVLATILEPFMPVLLNTCGVICLDMVNLDRLFWQLNVKLVNPPAEIIGPPNFEEAARVQQVDVSNHLPSLSALSSAFVSLPSSSLGQLFGADSLHVMVTMLSAIRNEPLKLVSLPPKSPESVVRWKSNIAFAP
jgi:hypothetical protein